MDTVGFIRDLPTNLIDAFKSTLDEIVNSDIILHVRDLSDDEYLLQKKEVLKILNEIGIKDDDKRIIEVNNKFDLVSSEYKEVQIARENIITSALSGQGINNLKMKITNKLSSLYKDSYLFKESYKT